MKFTIRDLFLVTVIVAILMAWWLDHWRLTRPPQPKQKTTTTVHDTT